MANIEAAGMANAGAAGSAATTDFTCVILGQCIQPECNTNHRCGSCNGFVHNMCNQHLRGSEDKSDNGFPCGGEKCRLDMTEGEQQEAIRHRDAVLAGACAGAGTPGPCSAGDNCVAQDGDQAITTKCKHGNGRHYACARVACSPDCYEEGSDEAVGGEEGGGDPETPGGSGDGTGVLTVDDSDETPAAATPNGSAQRTSKKATPASSRRTSGEGVGPSRSMRTRLKASTPSKHAATPSKGESVVLPLQDIKVCVADALTQLFGDKKIVGDLVARMAGHATEANAKKAVLAAINSNSKDFIAAAKNAGKEACAKHLEAPLANLAKTQESAATTWKAASADAAAKWKAAAVASAKGSSQKNTPQPSEAKLTAAAKAGANANNDVMMTLVKAEVATQVLQLKTELETRITEMESSAKADLETRFGSLFTSIQCGLQNACEYISGVVKENGRQLDESISGSKRGATSKTPSPKRRSPRGHEATRQSDEREDAKENGALAAVDGNTIMKIAAAVGTAMSQGNANQARVSDQTQNNAMAQGTQSMGGFASVPPNMMQARGAGASTMGMMQNQGTGASSIGMMPTQGVGAFSMGIMPGEGARASSMGMGATTQRMDAPSQGFTNNPTGYMHLFGQHNGVSQGNGYPHSRFN